MRYIEQLQKYDVDYGEASIEDEYADTVTGNDDSQKQRIWNSLS